MFIFNKLSRLKLFCVPTSSVFAFTSSIDGIEISLNFSSFSSSSSSSDEKSIGSISSFSVGGAILISPNGLEDVNRFASGVNGLVFICADEDISFGSSFAILPPIVSHLVC